jgi:alanine dehydrogenase
MPCVDRGLGLAGLKTFAWTPGASPFLVVLMTIEDPEIVAVLEADTLGQLRTAAASAVAAKQLARAGASSLGVIGCGRQAASHVTALRAQLPSLTRVVVYCRDDRSRESFCREHGCEAAVSASDAAGCDIVVTATTSVTPVVRGDWVRDGALVVAVGANDPVARELDDRVLERVATVYVDSRDQAREEAGDLIEPAERGLVRWNEVAELQDVVAGTRPGRVGEADVLLFKSSGLAAWDLAVAARVVELA